MKHNKLVSALFAATIFFTACKDDHEHDHSHEEVNMLRMTLKSPTGDSTVVNADLSKTPFTIDTLKINKGVVYNIRVRLFDNTANKMEDITAAIEREGNEHLMLYCAANGQITVTKTDLDGNARAIGLKGNLTASEAGKTSLRLKLMHDAKKDQIGTFTDCDIMNNINQAGNKVGGETDLDTTIPVVVAP